MIVCDALLMPADISEQTESIRANITLGLNCNLEKMVEFGQQSIPYFSLFLASAAVATALASLWHQICMRLQRCRHITGQTSMGQWKNRQVACHLIYMHRPMGSSVNGTSPAA